jgi:hypothetical protein
MIMAAPALVVGRRTGALPIGLHVPAAIGPVYHSVVSPFGERYSTDELHHRVVVEHGDERCAFGRPGAGAGEFSFPRGLAFAAGRTRSSSRLFVCDAWNDRVQVFDGHGVFVFAFGGRGTGPGLFNAPSGLALVQPVLAGDEEHPFFDREAMLAVADRENRRLQVFALDGTLVSVVGEGLDHPSRIAWQAPWLEISCAGGRTARLDLGSAMLEAAASVDLTPRRPRPFRLRLVVSGGVRCAG